VLVVPGGPEALAADAYITEAVAAR
jgi:hypothetical protein